MQQEGYSSKNVIEMLTVANEYCYFAENIENFSKEAAIDFIHKIGSLLYLKGTLLPHIHAEHPEANERFVTEEQWETVFNVMRNLFGDTDIYYFVPFDAPAEGKKASLSENLTDIYQDMKDFILLYQKNSVAAKENASAECKNLFELRWGKRVLSVIQYLHFIKYEKNKNDGIYEFL